MTRTIALLITFLALALGVAIGVAGLPNPGTAATTTPAVQHLDTTDRPTETRPHPVATRLQPKAPATQQWPAQCAVGVDQLEARGLTEAQAFAARTGCGMDDPIG